MSLRSLAAVSALMVGDWGLWTWSINADHGTISLLAGLLMAPLFVAFAWLAAISAAAGMRELLSRLRPAPPRARAPLAQPASTAPEQETRLAA